MPRDLLPTLKTESGIATTVLGPRGFTCMLHIDQLQLPYSKASTMERLSCDWSWRSTAMHRSDRRLAFDDGAQKLDLTQVHIKTPNLTDQIHLLFRIKVQTLFLSNNPLKF